MKKTHTYMTGQIVLTTSLKKLGYDESLKESIRAMNLYGCIMPDSNVSLTSFSDIMLFFSDKTWYNDNVIKKQPIIHKKNYGIYCKGWDLWLQGIETDWLKEHKLQVL